MYKEYLSSIVQNILQFNPFLQRGFADAWRDEKTGQVFATTEDGCFPVFPADEFGNYCYIRSDQKIRIIQDDKQRISDCQQTANLIKGKFFLVCVFTDLDEEKVLERILGTLAIPGEAIIKVKNIIWNREEIISRELADAHEIAIDTLLARPHEWRIVSLTFQLIAPIQITNPNCLQTTCLC